MTAAIPSLRILAFAALCLCFVSAAPGRDRTARAQDDFTQAATAEGSTPATNPVNHVLELFTSQGCVSCPPADAILTELSRRADVLALAYHVDYWDYIGWHDTFGSPENTERQRDYAKAFDTTTVYTPQLVVNGTVQTVGSREHVIEKLIDTHDLPQNGSGATVEMRMQGDRMHIVADAKHVAPGSHMPVLVFVIYGSEKTTTIDSGANSGHDLVNTHPVLSWRVLGMWSGKPLEIDMPAAMLRKNASGGGCAVLLQAVKADGAPGAILAAARLPFADWISKN